MARFSPGWKALASVMLKRPSCKSARRLRAPSARLTRRVGEEIVDRGHGVHELLEVELEAPLLGAILSVGLLSLLQQEIGCQQIIFLERLVEGVLLPVGL